VVAEATAKSSGSASGHIIGRRGRDAQPFLL
jgi:predicted RNA-binding protein YlqC (UPF0109 family)